MKINVLLLFAFLTIIGCHKKEISSISEENWLKRKAVISDKDSLEYGESYLSIYSQIYSVSEHKTHNLTVMVSLRNISTTDSIYVLQATYHDTDGTTLRNYFKYPIYLAPLETTEIIIDEVDVSGGTGSNFIFEWKTPKDCPEPLFEGIMNSTVGQQGLSFTTQSLRIK
jgi:hypothetical protein